VIPSFGCLVEIVSGKIPGLQVDLANVRMLFNPFLLEHGFATCGPRGPRKKHMYIKLQKLTDFEIAFYLSKK
jgi:hypothetical protein